MKIEKLRVKNPKRKNMMRRKKKAKMKRKKNTMKKKVMRKKRKNNRLNRLAELLNTQETLSELIGHINQLNLSAF